jgi:hypothetical protein
LAFPGSGDMCGTGSNPAVYETGTDLATNTKSLGAVPSTSPASRSWGGARNKRSRTSVELSHSQAVNIIEAAGHAAALSLPLNRHITIHWGQAGILDCEAAAATGRYVKLVADCIAKRGGRFACVWVRENGDGKGTHVHILAHIPAGFALARMQRRWLRHISGRPYLKGTIKTTRIGGRLAAAQGLTEGYRANLREVVAYVLKGVSADSAAALGFDKLEPGGRIIGKRCGSSQNLGRQARVGMSS